MKEQRKLAAIMFTDIAGYTALMGKDEEKALRILQKNRDVLKPVISSHKGKWLKEMGDGTLSSFPSAVEAVNCALEIQRSLKDETEFKLRIGIHIGDVVISKGDIFGSGVNIASRIEPLAKSGGICISERVFDDIRNKPGIEAISLGEKHLKNVDHPVRVYALTIKDLPKPHIERTGTEETEETKTIGTSGTPPKNRIVTIGIAAVVVIAGIFGVLKLLPGEAPELVENKVAVAYFENRTGETTYDYLEELAAANLTQGLNQLDFIETVQFIEFSDDIKDMRFSEMNKAISEKTGAKNIVYGSFNKRGNDLSFQPNIVNIETGDLIKELPPYKGNAENPEAVIDSMIQRVQSVFALKFDKVFEPSAYRLEFTSKVPKYSTLRLFIEGLRYHDALDRDNAILKFKEAIEQEPDFYYPYLQSMTLQPFAIRDSMRNVILNFKTNLTNWEQLYFENKEAYLDGNLNEHYLTGIQLADMDPSNYRRLQQAGLYSLWVNKLEEAEELNSRIDRETMKSWDVFWNRFGEALHLLENYEEQRELAKQHKEYFPGSRLAVLREIQANIGLGNIDEVRNLINEFDVTTDRRNLGVAKYLTVSDLYKHGYIYEANEYIQESIQWYVAQPNLEESTPLREQLFNVLYMAEYVLEKAETSNIEQVESMTLGLSSGAIIKERMKEIAKDLESENPGDPTHIGRLGFVYAINGETDNAIGIIRRLEQLDRPYMRGTNLRWLAIISAHLDERERAMVYLKDAFSKGYPFGIHYHNNPLYEPLWDFPDFQEFIKPRK